MRFALRMIAISLRDDMMKPPAERDYLTSENTAGAVGEKLFLLRQRLLVCLAGGHGHDLRDPAVDKGRFDRRGAIRKSHGRILVIAREHFIDCSRSEPGLQGA